MPRPCPGIDPYIEFQDKWKDFHASFLTYCRDALLDILPTGYEAEINEDFRPFEWDEPRGRLVEPDVAVVRLPGGSSPAGAAVGLLAEPVTVPFASVVDETIRHTWIEVRGLPDRSLITVIGLLSPTNKYGPGRTDYLNKRLAYRRQEVHLIELDFLLTGHRLPMGAPLPPGDYYAFVARAGRRPDCDVYSWTLADPLPNIPVPLKAPDPDVILDLPAVYATAFEKGRYGRRLDRAREPGLPLDPGTLDRIRAFVAPT